MTLTEQISLISFAVIVVFCMAAYLRSHSRYETGIFHRAGCFLLYGYLRISLAVRYAEKAVMLKLGSICSGYHSQEMPEGIYHKECRLQELQRELFRSGCSAGRHNLKLPD